MIQIGTKVRLSERYDHDGFNTMVGATWQPGHEGEVTNSEVGPLTGDMIYTVEMYSPVMLMRNLRTVYVTEDELEVME